MTPGLDSPHLVVRSSAGTGKTWLLSSRVVRLLLEGAAPGGILAITFTKKAAAEIQQRVLARLRHLVDLEASALHAELETLGLPPTAGTAERARTLYETLLSAERPVRATTFHAFCQELLRRFPYEAGVPPGFELVALTEPLEAGAWAQFEADIAEAPEAPLARAADRLLQACGGVSAFRQALMGFIAHRSDWWSYTEDQEDAIALACARTRDALQLPPHSPFAAFEEHQAAHHLLARYAALLARTPLNATQTKALEWVTAANAPGIAPEARFGLATRAFLTADGAPRVFKISKALASTLGEAASAELADVHAKICSVLLEAHEWARRTETLQATVAWMTCGHHLLERYQRLKQERRQLDFADLEWKAYRLLNASQHAEWVQYKLDQRIDHLLVDEFQDTNRTQWELLLPLLSEIAAGAQESRRSIFIVGDEKQSIYRFRRADPRLLAGAEQWLVENLDAATLAQHTSWRASPAIIRFVNLLFAQQSALPDFPVHDTHRTSYWGTVEVLPLVVDAPDERPPSGGLRNPLTQPRITRTDTRYQREADAMAARIADLVANCTVVGENGPRAAAYGDVMILLRDRTHAHYYENALRHRGIPYVGAHRGRFTRCLEVRDLIQLLRALIMPYDDLALASALKSPIFGCSDEELMALSLHVRHRGRVSWRDALRDPALALPADSPLARARERIDAWSAVSDRVPVHDLLDRIFNEGDVLARYASAAPAHLQQRVEANLQRLFELALEIDSGRYPSLERFLALIDPMTRGSEEPPGRADERGQVRVMTVHAAKGLEAPIVFLVDAALVSRRERAWRPLIDWPLEAPRPRHFHFVGKKDRLDAVSTALIKKEEQSRRQEEMNLLYVALTRAKQWLFISGCAPRRGASGAWYSFMEERVRAAGASCAGLRLPGSNDEAFHCRLSYGDAPKAKMEAAAPAATPVADARLQVPLPDVRAQATTVRPSQSAAPTLAGDGDTTGARRRGKALHRMLQALSGGERASARRWMEAELAGSCTAEEFEAYWQEALGVVEHRAFACFFDPCRYVRAMNEVPILYFNGEREVYGVIDRVVLRHDRVVIVEYKTHARATKETLSMLVPTLAPQVQFYAAGARRIWPERGIEAHLLFTACRESVAVTLA